MQTLRIYPSSINDRFLDQAVKCLSDGGIIIYPTDTLYALACDALNQGAIERLCRLKGLNTQKNTLSIVCADISQASEYARIDNHAYAILRRCTPGAFTFILPAATTLPKAFKGRKNVGVRIPDNAIARALVERLGNPLLTTSIPVEEVSEFDVEMPDDIALHFESQPIDMMIDGGQGGTTPSTIVDITDSTNPEILRQGLADFDE